MERTLSTFFFIFYSCLTVVSQQPKDSTAHFKKIADEYRKMGFPEEGVQIMVQMERERLYPELKQKADEKRGVEGRRHARESNSPTEDDNDNTEAQKMMDDAVSKMGKDPGEVNKKMAEIPNTTPNEIPKPGTRPIAATPASEAALLVYLNSMLQKAEAAIGAARKTKASQYTGKGRETGYAGIAFWINKEHDIALYLMLKASVASPRDLILINNFATCLSMCGLPEKAIPLLNFINNKLPDNATVLNNLGQAWLSTGNISKAKPLLEKAASGEDASSEANRSLSKIASKESNSTKAAEYLGKAMERGFDIETYNAWRKLSPGKDVATLIRGNHKRFYKEVPITKRWILPDMPTHVTEAQEKEESIQQFFADLDATLLDIASKTAEMSDADHEVQSQQFLQMQQQVKDMKTLDDVQQYNNRFGKLFHPLRAQAQLMLNSIRSNDYSTSYNKRIEQAVANRNARLVALNTSLKPMQARINALSKEAGSLEGGEKGDEEMKIQSIERQMCTLAREIQVLQFTSEAEINIQHIKVVEGILNQRLQEEMYWTVLYTLPNDPSGASYGLYERYLTDLSRFRSLYPIPAPLKILCDEEKDGHKPALVTGKLKVWEDSHCPIDINISAMLAEAKMNCHEIKIGGKIGGVSVSWERKIDVVTWETLEHSISIGGGLKEFETDITSRIKGKVGIDGKVSIKLDRDLVPTDLILKGESGAEISGPLGGKAGVDIGSIEISIQGGLRGEGPVPELAARMFGS